MQKLLRYALFIVLVPTAGDGAFNSARAEVFGDISVLHRVRELQLENLKRLRQWRGSAEVVLRSELIPEGYISETRAAVRFLQDNDRDEMAYNWKVTDSSIQRQGEKETKNPFLNCISGGWQKQDEQYSMRQLVPSVTDVGSVSAGVRVRTPAGDLDWVLHPMDYFRIKGDETDAFFRYIFSIADRDWVNLEINQQNNLVFLVWGNTALRGGGRGSRVTFDLDSSGCCIQSEARLIKPENADYEEDYGGIMTRKTEYENIDGVFVPRRFEFVNSSPHTRHHHSRSVVFRTDQINVPIPEDEFGFEFMGVPEGSRIFDSRLRTLSVYQPIKSAEATDLSELTDSAGPFMERQADRVSEHQPESPASDSFSSSVLLWLVGACILGIAVWQLILRGKG